MTDLMSVPSFLEEVKRELQQRLRREQFDSWFRGLRLVRMAKEEVEFSVPTGFVRDWLTRNYLTMIQESVQAAALRIGWIPLQLNPSTFRVRITTHGCDPQVDTGGATEARPQAEILDVFTRAEEGAVPLAKPSAGLAGDPGPDAGVIGAATDNQGGRTVTTLGALGEIVLNPGYTFDQFVVGPCNRLSHAAALAIGENPGRAYNPLFIHGNVGLGKTHLLQAVCHAILRRQKKSRVLYMSCEEFTNRFIHAIQTGKLEEFRGYYRNADVLVVDDVQFLSNKGRTQEEFFHTFNALYNQQKQIVISSDHPPLEIPEIEDRLISRFKWGLVTEVEQPCFETRIAVVKRKARMRGLDLPDDVAYFIAERVSTNIRELEGAIIKVIGFATLMEREIDLSLAEEALRGAVPLKASQVSLQEIIELITREFSVTVRDLTGKSRSQAHTLPRQIGMFLARELTTHSLEEIGRSFGGRDHTTVLYSVQKVKTRAETDRMFRDLLGTIGSRLQGRH